MNYLDRLVTLWHIAKAKEDGARAERATIEEDILKYHPAKEEGSETVKTELGYKVKITGKIIYKADVDKLIALTGSWPDDIRPVRTKVEADDTRLKAIRAERPDLWRLISDAVETKPAKTNIAIDTQRGE